MDLISGKLPIDVAEITVEYEQGNGEDIRSLPYATPVWHYIGANLQRKLYLKSVDRLKRNRYRLNCISAVGILDKQYHKGGVYNGTLFSALIDDLIDDAVPYTCEAEVGSTKIFGWLPYATKRDNLHQILFAENISILKNASGDMHFVFNRLPVSVPEIQESRIFIDGEISYPAVASKVNLTEHSYQKVDTVERVTLIDNADKVPASSKLFVFDTAPIDVDTLVASAGLTVNESGVNYAIVTGQGTLTGKPYYDKTSVVQKTFNNGGGDYAVSITDATLVTGVNSENVAERLLSYYTSGKMVNADIKLSGEKCGGVYQFTDMFGERVSAYLTKMASKISSFIRAACELVSGYTPDTFGNNYSYWAAVEHNGWIVIPEGTTIARFVIIGGGDGASSGLRGVDDFTDLYAGSKGGEPGTAGKGGKIREVVLHNPAAGTYNCTIGNGGKGGNECESSSIRNNGEAGDASTVTTPGGAVYSSGDNGFYRSTNGIKNLFTDTVYAKSGKPGIKGGDGGRGSVSGLGEDGQDVEYLGKVYKGGKGGTGTKYDFKNIDQSLSNGGAGGCGAQAYADGLDGGQADSDGFDFTESGYRAWEIVKQTRGKPPLLTRPSKWKQEYQPGDGGDAGQGGAGRGGFGGTNSIYMNYAEPNSGLKVMIEGYVEQAEREEYGFDPTIYHSSNGSAGKNGAPGIVLCYADQPLESYAPQYEPPTIEYTGYDENVRFDFADGSYTFVDVLHFGWNNTGASSYLFQYHVSGNGGYTFWGQDRDTLTYTVDRWTEVEITSSAQTISEIVNLPTRGYLVEARVISLEDGAAAESEPSEAVLAFALPATHYDAPKLVVTPTYRDARLRIGLFAKHADFVYLPLSWGNVKYNTIWRKTNNSEWEYLFRANLPLLYDVLTEEGVQYTYKSAFLGVGASDSGRMLSQFSEEYTTVLPNISEIETKLLPPIIMDGAYIIDGATIGDVKWDTMDFLYGITDHRADKLQIWAVDEGYEETRVYEGNIPGTSATQSAHVRVSSINTSRSTFTFKMKFVDSNGVYATSDYSENTCIIEVPDNKLPRPVVTNKTVIGTQLTMEWGAVEHAASYTIGRYSNSQNTYVQVTNLSSNVTSYVAQLSDDDISDGQHWWFIQAKASSGYINSQCYWVTVDAT